MSCCNNLLCRVYLSTDALTAGRVQAGAKGCDTLLLVTDNLATATQRVRQCNQMSIISMYLAALQQFTG